MNDDLHSLLETARGIEHVSVSAAMLTESIIPIHNKTFTADGANDWLKAWWYVQSNGKPIKLIINSTGGEVTAGLLIHDLIQSSKLPVKIYCAGCAYSMAAVILASGEKGSRYILPHSKVMIHEPLIAGGIGGSATSISRVSDSILETREMLNGILAQHTNKSIEEINKATAFDNVMNAEQAVEFGICDKITDVLF